MKKCEVLKDCALSVGKGSIVIVSDVQYNIASELLKPITEEVNEVAIDDVIEEPIEEVNEVAIDDVIEEPIEEVNEKSVKEEKNTKKK